MYWVALDKFNSTTRYIRTIHTPVKITLKMAYWLTDALCQTCTYYLPCTFPKPGYVLCFKINPCNFWLVRRSQQCAKPNLYWNCYVTIFCMFTSGYQGSMCLLYLKDPKCASKHSIYGCTPLRCKNNFPKHITQFFSVTGEAQQSTASNALYKQ